MSNLNGRPRLIVMATTAVLVVIVAIAVIALNAGGSAAPGTSSASTGSGPFLTASAIPPGLGGRTVPGFRLADGGRGGALASSSLRGRPYALTFLYVRCVDVCPLIGSEIQGALAQLGPQAQRMNVVAVSVDPRGDTRAAVRQWLKLHREPANFHYLVGPQRALAPVWKAFYVSPQKPGDPQSAHTAVVWLIDRRGRVAALISAGVAIDVKNLAHDFRVLIGKA